jgi:hypothetical protein
MWIAVNDALHDALKNGSQDALRVIIDRLDRAKEESTNKTAYSMEFDNETVNLWKHGKLLFSYSDK